MRLSNDALVSEAELVSTELIHAALSWLEAWHAGLEEASRLYFGAHDAVAMLATLAPLHAQLDGGATTARERWFEGQYGRELREARGHTRAYEEGGGKGCLGAAWDVYYACYRRMAKHLSRLTRSSSRTSRRSCWTRPTSSSPSPAPTRRVNRRRRSAPSRGSCR